MEIVWFEIDKRLVIFFWYMTLQDDDDFCNPHDLCGILQAVGCCDPRSVNALVNFHKKCKDSRGGSYIWYIIIWRLWVKFPSETLFLRIFEKQGMRNSGTWGPGTQDRVKLAYQAKQLRFSVFI